MDNSNVIKQNEHSQQNIIALLKHIKEENNNYKNHNNDNSVLTSSTMAVPFEIHKVVEQKKQCVQMSPEIIHYQVQTYQTPINRVDNSNNNSNTHNVKQDSLIIESIHKGSNVTFSNDTAKTNPSPFQHCQMISDGITDTQQISTPNLDYNYDINTYNSFLTQINPKTYNNNIRTPSPKKKLKLSKSTNNFFTDKSDLFFNTSLSQNGLLNITDSKTYQMGKPSNYENDLIIKKSFINNKFKNKMSEYIISNNNKYKYNKAKSKTQKSKSLNHNTIKHPHLNDSYYINGNGNIKHVNKNELFRKGKKISLMMNILKNPNDKDLVLEITRGMREEKGGVVDFALIKNDKCSSSSSQIVKYGKNSLCINNKKVISSAKIIQRWWRNIIYIYNMLNIKVIKIQSVYRGWYYRCLLNNNRNKLKGNVLILKEEEQQQQQQQRCKHEELFCCCNGVNNIEIIQYNNKVFKDKAMCLMKNVLMIYLYRVYNEFRNNVNKRIKTGDVIDKGVNSILSVLRKNVLRAKFMNDPLTKRLREKCLKSIIRNRDNSINNKIKTCLTKWKMCLYCKNNNDNKCKTPLDLIVTSNESVCSYLHQMKRPIINEISFEDAFSYMNRPKYKLQSILSTINECELYYNSLLKVKSFEQIFPSKVNELNIISNNITNNKQQQQQLLPLNNVRVEYTITPLIKQNLFQISKSNLNICSLSHKQTPNIIENTHYINITPIHSNIKPFEHVIQPQTSVHSFKSTPNPLKHIPNEDNRINIQPQLQNENCSLIMKSKKRFLTKQITINDLRNKISLHLAFMKWYRKSLALKNKKRVNVRKRLTNDNDNKIQNVLYRNLFRYIITQIQNEAKRRQIIKLFYHIKRLKLPIQHYAFSKIKEYANVKYKLMNLYAMLIQRYYRMKYKNGNNMLLIEDNEIIKSTQIIIEETYPQHYAFQYKTYITSDDNNHTHIHGTKQYVSLAHLMDDFFRKYIIRHIIELLYCVYYKQ